MYSPRPPAPMAAAMVARPIEITAATRTPAMITPSASGKFHLPEKLAIGHAHAASGFDDGAIHALDAGVGVANERQQRVQREREDGEAVGTCADPGRGQKESEKREAGNGLDNVCAAEHRLFQHRPACDQNAERDSNQHGEDDGSTDQPEMFGGEFQDFGVVLDDELEDVHDGLFV